MNDDGEWIIVGRFGRPHGIKGLVTVLSFTDPKDNILLYKHWYMRVNYQWQPIKLLQLETNNKCILARVENHFEREDVQRLTNIDIAVKHEALPSLKPGEYYWHQLVGMQVVTQQGAVLGKVADLIATGANDVLVVLGTERHLIPYLPGRYVMEINDIQRVITVDWDVDF